jgi:hypothetical protein
MGTFSFLINHVWLGPEHEVYSFLRPDDDPRVTPGLGLSTLLWSALITAGYQFFGPRITIRNPFAHGAAFGFLVYVCFVFFQELLYYQFIEFDWIIIAGALLHYLVSFTLGCGLIGVITRPRE